MKIIVVLLFISGIMITGCIKNPAEQVPVVQVNLTLVEKQGIAEAEDYTMKQGTVNYLSRPRHIQAESFPAIGARTTILKGKNSSIGPWEMVPYNGSGRYSFNIGFDEEHYPAPNDTVHVSIIVIDKNGERKGYIIKDIIWN